MKRLLLVVVISLSYWGGEEAYSQESASPLSPGEISEDDPGVDSEGAEGLGETERVSSSEKLEDAEVSGDQSPALNEEGEAYDGAVSGSEGVGDEQGADETPSPVDANDLNWDPVAFQEANQAAEIAYYEAEDYTLAQSKYDEAVALLEVGLEQGEIPRSHQSSAEIALSDLKYQRIRATMKLGECDESLERLRDLKRSRVETTFHQKVDLRMAEALHCVSRNQESAESLVSILEARGLLKGLVENESIAVELAEAIDAQKALERSKQTELEGTLARAVKEGECSKAIGALIPLQQLSPDGALGYQASVADCSNSDLGSIAPFIVMGAGATFLIAGGGYEILNSSKLSDLDDARDACLTGQSGRCSEALTLADDIETQRVVSGTLLGSGVALAVGGALWWYLSHEEEQALVMAPCFDGEVSGASALIRW